MVNAGITFNGRHSYRDFGVTVNKIVIGEPVRQEIRETVAYMNGSWDFSWLNGLVLSDRTITVTFNLSAADFDSLYILRAELVEWLYSAHDTTLEFDPLNGHFTGVSAVVPKNGFDIINERTAQLKVEFTAAPYRTVNGREAL